MHFAKGSVESTHKVPTRDQPLPLSTTLLVGTPLLISKIGILSIFVVVVLRSPRRGSWGGRAEFLGARSFRHDLVSATALTIGGAHKPLNGDLRGFFGSRKGFFRYITTTTYLDAIMLYHIQYHDQYHFISCSTSSMSSSSKIDDMFHDHLANSTELPVSRFSSKSLKVKS